MTVEGRFDDFLESFLPEACGKQHVSNDLPSGNSNDLMTPSSPVFPPCVFSSSASGFTSGGPSILAPRLPSASQTTPSGRWWQPTCFTPSLPSWWPCAFTATPIFSSRSPPSLGRQVCPTVWRRTPSTKINSRLEVIWSCDDSWGAAQNTTIQDYFAQHIWSDCFFFPLFFRVYISLLLSVILSINGA